MKWYKSACCSDGKTVRGSKNVRTAQRWEQEEQLPVHRHQHGRQDTVYAYTAEIDRWIEERDRLARNGSDAKPQTFGKAWLAVFVVAALVAGFVFFWRPALGTRGPTALSSLAFEERDWLLIADFDNRTGDPLLDGTLEAALRREIANSPVVNVVPRERVADALLLMGMPADVPLDAALAQEVARQG